MKSAATRALSPDVHAARAASATAARLLVDLPTVRRRRRRRLITAVIVLLVAATSYAMLALTLVMLSQPINGTLYLINRVGVTDGAAPAGATLLMDLDNNGSNWSQRWISTTWRIHRPAVVEVVSPWPPPTGFAERGRITANWMSPSHDGLPDSVPQPGTYLVTCLAGACLAGTLMLVPAANTIGSVEATISF